MDGKNLIAQAEDRLKDAFGRIDEIALVNQMRVLSAFKEHKLTEEFFAERTGYGMEAERGAADKFASAVIVNDLTGAADWILSASKMLNRPIG